MTDTHQAVAPATAHHSAAGTGDAYWFFDALMVVRAAEPGQPVIIEATVAPGGGAPLHVHTDLDDSFYLVSGRLAFRCGEQSFAVEPGAYVALPHGVPHTFRVVGDEPRSCCRCTPTTRSCASSRPSGGPPESRAAARRPADGHGRRVPGRRADRPAGHRAADER